MLTKGTVQGYSVTMTRRHDNMVIPLLERENHGSNRNYSSGVRGHLRPLNYHSCSAHIFWTGLLGNVGTKVGEGDNSCNLCNIQLSAGEDKGEKTWT